MYNLAVHLTVCVWFVLVFHSCFMCLLLCPVLQASLLGKIFQVFVVIQLIRALQSWVAQIPAGCNKILLCACIWMWKWSSLGCLSKHVLREQTTTMFVGKQCVDGKWAYFTFSDLSWKSTEKNKTTNTSLFVLFLSVLLRPGSPSLSSCCRQCSGSTIVIGWSQSRRAQLRTASRCSLMLVRSFSFSAPKNCCQIQT